MNELRNPWCAFSLLMLGVLFAFCPSVFADGKNITELRHGGFPTVLTRIVRGADNNIYVTGYAVVGKKTILVTFRGDFSGAHWSELAPFDLDSASPTAGIQGWGIQAPLPHLLFAVGAGTDGQNITKLYVIRSVDDGKSWSVVDAFPPGALQPKGGFALSLRLGPGGAIYYSGWVQNPANSIGYAITRRSLDMGKTWSTYDSHGGNSSSIAVTRDVSFDPFGNLYLVGSDPDASPADPARHDTVLRRCDHQNPECGVWLRIPL